MTVYHLPELREACNTGLEAKVQCTAGGERCQGIADETVAKVQGQDLQSMPKRTLANELQVEAQPFAQRAVA
jgi:hypothetical protein